VAALTQNFDELPKALIGYRGEMAEPEWLYQAGGVFDGESLRSLDENHQDNQD
jgi:hypothetical protein